MSLPTLSWKPMPGGTDPTQDVLDALQDLFSEPQESVERSEPLRKRGTMTPKQQREHTARLARLQMILKVRTAELQHTEEDLARAKAAHLDAERAQSTARRAVEAEEVAPDLTRLPEELRARIQSHTPLDDEDRSALARRGLAERVKVRSSERIQYRLTPRGVIVFRELRHPAPSSIQEPPG